MATIGRNDLCPCGSNKKYKKCCWLNEQPSSHELQNLRYKQMRSKLIDRIGKHAFEVYGPEAIHEAYEEFHLWEHENGFDPESKELAVFMPWFFYQWFPDPEVSTDESTLLISPAESLLAMDKSLSSMEKEYLLECCRTGFSFYEVMDVIKGKAFTLKDVLTEEIYEVFEKSGTQKTEKGDLLFGKVINFGGVGILEACAPIIIPPQAKIMIIDFRKHLKKKNKKITDKVLNDYSIEILEVYRDIYDALMRPSEKILTNTDGHLLVPHKLIFEIDDSMKTFDTLHVLDFNDSREDLLKEASFDKQNNLIKVEFPWLKKGNKKNNLGGNTVLGNICIEFNKMTVEVNSKERANKFQSELKKMMPSGWKLKGTLLEPIESKLKNSKKDDQALLEAAQEQEELMKNPQVREHIEKMMKAHWENWVNTPIPALGGLKPTEAKKSKEGKEKLIALLNQFERNAAANPSIGQTVDTIREVRGRLGL